MIDMGTYKVKCIDQNGVALSTLGGYTFAYEDEIDLLDPNLSGNIRCSNWSTADTLCRDSAFELAQMIEAGRLEVTEQRRPKIKLPGEQ